MRAVNPPGWPPPRGYANAIVAEGVQVFVAGQVGWTPAGRFETDDLAGQVRQALENVRDVLAAAGARPADVTRLTWYVIDRREYLARLGAVGEAYRAVMGAHYPAMTLIEVRGLVEERARVEIEATAVIPRPAT